MFKGKRIEGEIPVTKSSSLPRRMLFFDTETYINKDAEANYSFDFRLGVAIFVELKKDNSVAHRVVSPFYSYAEFEAILLQHLKPKKLLYVFAHNIGFDVRVLNLPYEFALNQWESEPPAIKERMFMWRVKSDKGAMLFLDTSNYGVQSVEELGKNVGYDKGDVDFLTVSNDTLLSYCIRDVEIIEAFVLSYVDFLNRHDLGKFCVTLASNSLTAFRHSFMKISPVIHNVSAAIELERKAYHGGRVECFFIGTKQGETFYDYDVNSMYPFAMVSGNVPTALRRFTQGQPIPDLQHKLDRFYVIADVALNTDEPVYGLVRNDKLLFPIGKFRTCLHHDELVYAQKKGHIAHVYSYATYDSAPIFTEYVRFFYDLKRQYTQENNNTWRYIAKLFLNSLYGKFGQLENHREHVSDSKYEGVYRLKGYNRQTEIYYSELSWYGKVYYEYRMGETPYSFPAIAGAITSRARMLLWEYIQLAGRENILYCDTDSLITNSIGAENLYIYCDNTELGKLKLEAISDTLEIWGNKDYKFGNIERIKGVPRKAKSLDKNSWEYIQFQGFISWLNAGALGSPLGHDAIKTRKGNYNKGIVSQSGVVLPHTI